MVNLGCLVNSRLFWAAKQDPVLIIKVPFLQFEHSGKWREQTEVRGSGALLEMELGWGVE